MTPRRTPTDFLASAALALASLVAFAAPPSPPSDDADGARSPLYYRPELPHPEPTSDAKRIVSLAPVVTETLFAVGAGSRVVGVTRYCDRPREAAELPKVGGYLDPQLEAILALRPDLVVAMPSRGQRRVLDRLREHGIPVLVVFADRIAEVRELVVAVGAAVGRVERAREVVASLDGALERIREGAAARQKALGSRAPRVLIAVGARPLVAAGPGTFAAEALSIAGGASALQEGGPAWPVLSAEAVAMARPDLIVAAEGPSARGPLEHELAGLGDARPPVVDAGRSILFRPGPNLAEDVGRLADLIAAAERRRASQNGG